MLDVINVAQIGRPALVDSFLNHIELQQNIISYSIESVQYNQIFIADGQCQMVIVTLQVFYTTGCLCCNPSSCLTADHIEQRKKNLIVSLASFVMHLSRQRLRSKQ
jgi:hypothetical protein